MSMCLLFVYEVLIADSMGEQGAARAFLEMSRLPNADLFLVVEVNNLT